LWLKGYLAAVGPATGGGGRRVAPRSRAEKIEQGTGKVFFLDGCVGFGLFGPLGLGWCTDNCDRNHLNQKKVHITFKFLRKATFAL
jgi:hypothetical protein